MKIDPKMENSPIWLESHLQCFARVRDLPWGEEYFVSVPCHLKEDGQN